MHEQKIKIESELVETEWKQTHGHNKKDKAKPMTGVSTICVLCCFYSVGQEVACKTSATYPEQFSF